MFIQIEVQTRSKIDFQEITALVQQAIDGTGIAEGICFLFCPHTTAGIVLNENWDPAVEADTAMILGRLAPADLPYRHAEGNSPAHVKSILVGSDHFIFVRGGRLQLGTWQGIFFAEFDGPRRRKVWLRVIQDQPSG